MKKQITTTGPHPPLSSHPHGDPILATRLLLGLALGRRRRGRGLGGGIHSCWSRRYLFWCRIGMRSLGSRVGWDRLLHDRGRVAWRGGLVLRRRRRVRSGFSGFSAAISHYGFALMTGGWTRNAFMHLAVPFVHVPLPG